VGSIKGPFFQNFHAVPDVTKVISEQLKAQCEVERKACRLTLRPALPKAKRPLKNSQFCPSSPKKTGQARRAKILTAGIHEVF
jgi:hypothetical protein